MSLEDGQYPRRMRRRAKAHALDRSVKQRAVLEAIAAAAIDDDLADDAVEVDADAAPEQHIYVLERDSCDVRARHTGQRLQGGLTRTRPADARQVGVEIERAHA